MFRFFPGNETVVAAVARHMLRHGLAPQDVLAEYDAWLAERLAEMEPTPTPSGPAGRLPQKGRLAKAPSVRGLPAKPGGGVRRRRAGDFAQLPASCPACGGTVEMYQMCPIESPVWRTQLACMADGCAWHGKSRLPIDALLAAGAAKLKDNVTEG